MAAIRAISACAKSCHTVFGSGSSVVTLLGVHQRLEACQNEQVERRRRGDPTALARDTRGVAQPRSSHCPKRPERRVLFILQDVRAGTRRDHGAGPQSGQQAPAPAAYGHDRSAKSRAPRSGCERAGSAQFLRDPRERRGSAPASGGDLPVAFVSPVSSAQWLPRSLAPSPTESAW